MDWGKCPRWPPGMSHPFMIVFHLPQRTLLASAMVLQLVQISNLDTRVTIPQIIVFIHCVLLDDKRAKSGKRKNQHKETIEESIIIESMKCE